MSPYPSTVPYTTLFRSPARSQHQPAKTGVSALMSSDAPGARTMEAPQEKAPERPQAVDMFGEAAETKHVRSEEHTSELQSVRHLVCRLLLEKKNDCKRG